MDRYESLRTTLREALLDLETLAGTEICYSPASWQDVAGTAALNLRVLASKLDSLRKGEEKFAGRFPWVGPTVFPSPAEVLAEAGVTQ